MIKLPGIFKKRDKVLVFHGRKCCIFKEKYRNLYTDRLELIKRYEGEDSTWYADHDYRSLWRCRECGALFLLEETEQINWSGGDDFFRDDYYQVESVEQADELALNYDGLFANYKGPSLHF